MDPHPRLRTALLALVAIALPVASPGPLQGQEAAQELIRQQTGRNVSQQEILQRLQASGMSRQQVRQELQRRGYDPSLADPYFDRIEGGGEGPLPEPSSSFMEALGQIGIGRAGIPGAGAPDTISGGTSPADTVAAADTAVADSLRVFGRQVFSRPTSQFQTPTTGPVDPGYRLGPGDQLILVITGDVEQAYTLSVTREGYVVIPDVGQVFVNGRTLGELEDHLYARLGEVYSGVERGPEATTHFDVSLGELRRNLVYVIGDVESPGAYQVSSLATVFNALHRAGGPTPDGSFRNVEVRRGGEVAGRVDLYDYLVHGDASDDIRLDQGDIVFVPIAGPQVRISGQVRRRAIYEMRSGEGLSELLAFAGGLRADAHPSRIQVDRILPPEERTPERERILVDVDLEAVRADSARVALRDGDRVAVFGISDERRDRVRISGDVFKPGLYEYLDGETVRGLVERAGGLRPSAYRRVAHVLRPDFSDGGTDLLPVRLEGGGDPEVPADRELRDRDRVVVFSVDSLNAGESVTVAGAVQESGSYELARGMTAEDAILAAGGFARGANPFRAEVVRRRVSVDRTDTLTTRIPVAISTRIPYPGNTLPDTAEVDRSGLVAAEGVPLRPDDRVIVRPMPGFSPIHSVQVVGEVRSPGAYVLETRRQTVTDLLTQAGGLTSDAYPEGFRLVRDSLPVGVNLAEALENPHGDEDPMVEPGDSLVFPTYDPTVQVQGAVAFDARVLYRDGWDLSDYLSQAGGALEEADEERISVEYPNGERAVRRERTLFFDSNPEVTPGSVVFVPTEPEDEGGFSVDQFISRAVSIASAAATVAIAVTRF